MRTQFHPTSNGFLIFHISGKLIIDPLGRLLLFSFISFSLPHTLLISDIIPGYHFVPCKFYVYNMQQVYILKKRSKCIIVSPAQINVCRTI